MSSFWPLFAANLVMTTVMALAVGLAGRWTPIRGHPGLRHALWLLVVAKLLTPPVFRCQVLPSVIPEAALNIDRGEPSPAQPLPSRATSTPESSSARSHSPGEREIASSAEPVRATLHSAAATGRAPSSGVPLVPLLAIIALPTALLLARSLWETRQIRRLVAQAAGADRRIAGIVTDACRRMRLPTPPEIRLVTGRLMPFLWVRFGRPTIVLPTPLIDRLRDDQVECIVCHELAHFIRRDHWSNTFALAVTAGYWWFPVAWWARRELLVAQEQCCDALVILSGGIPRRRYAETLFKTIEFINDERLLLPALASGFGRVSAVRRRFEMIAGQRVGPRFPILSAALALLVVGAFCSLPVRGQAARQAAEEQPPPATDDAAAPRPSLAGKLNGNPIPVVEKGELKYRTAKVTVDAIKHCLFVGQQPATGQGALRLDLERGVTYTVSAAGEAFTSAQTGVDVDPFPGLVFYYSTDEEDGYAIRYVVLKAGDSVTFRTPWLISPGDEVFALAFFLDAWPDADNHGSYTLTFQRHDESAREATIPATGGRGLRFLKEALDRPLGQPQQGQSQQGQSQQGQSQQGQSQQGQPQQGQPQVGQPGKPQLGPGR